MLVYGVVLARRRIRDGTGLPMLAVLVTVAFWYVGDAFYNDYAENHVKLFTPDILSSAWWQVAWFLLVFILVTPIIYQRINRRHLHRSSGVMQLFKYGVGQPTFQTQLNLLFKGCLMIWGVLVLIALIRLKDQIPYFFFPFLGYKAEPWGRARIGSGFDAALSLAFYFQLLVTGIFGVVAALSTNSRTRKLAFACCLLSWPYFIFDRTRNTMLAAVIPGVLSWGLLRVRGPIWKKGLVLGVCFLVVNAWMEFVIANRSKMSIAAALNKKGFSLENNEKTRHLGLNMFEELCWINTFIDRGSFNPSWGGRYFAEAVNMVPRAIWRNKPMIGIDYAIARGQGGGTAGSAGVYATISTGMIGQGVVNFGRFLGPAAAALLMSLWVAALARLDLHAQELGRVPLYGSGLILTFNLGRDITLITLYPIVFGALAIWWIERHHKHLVANPAQMTARPLSRFSPHPRSRMHWKPAKPISRPT